MFTLEELRAAIRENLAKRAAEQDKLDTVVATAEERGDGALTADEQSAFDAAKAAIVTYDEERSGLEQREAEMADLAQRKAAAEALAATLPIPANAGQPVRVTSEPRTYTKRNPDQFGLDVARALIGDPNAAARLDRHMTEERVERGADLELRDVGVGQFTGLVVPQYVTEMAAPLRRAMRPTADNCCTHHDLPPSGMTINISRITTGSAAAIQATENTGVQETDMDDTLLTVNVRTIAGQQDVSRQAIERGTGVDDIVVADLIAAYHTTLDNQIINADGTSGTILGILNTTGNNDVTYTDASPTAAEAWPKLYDAIQQIQAGVYMGATHVIMAPRRWAWFASQVGTNFPFVQQIATAPQVAGEVSTYEYGGVVGTIAGLGVVVDGNISLVSGGGTEDTIIVVAKPALHLWEEPGAPTYLRAELSQVQNLTIRLVVYGYAAFTAGHYPAATSNVTGTGLAAPVF